MKVLLYHTVTVLLVVAGLCSVIDAKVNVTIKCPDDFLTFASSFSSEEEYVVNLESDLDLSSSDFSCPIGSPNCNGNDAQGKSFKGEFYGNNYVISGINMSGNENAGLFWDISNATFDSLVIKDCHFSGTVSGALASTVSGVVTANNVKSSSVVRGDQNAGGLIGIVNIPGNSGKVSMNSCVVNGSVSLSGTGSKVSLGGFIGAVSAQKSVTINMTKCTNWMSLSVNDGVAAGFIGSVKGISETVTFDHCFNAGNITSENGDRNSFIGGLIGSVKGQISLNIYFSQNSGSCSGVNAEAVGGFIGFISGGSTSSIFVRGSRNSGNIISKNSCSISLFPPPSLNILSFAGGFIGKVDEAEPISFQTSENLGNVSGFLACGFVCLAYKDVKISDFVKFEDIEKYVINKTISFFSSVENGNVTGGLIAFGLSNSVPADPPFLVFGKLDPPIIPQNGSVSALGHYSRDFPNITDWDLESIINFFFDKTCFLWSPSFHIFRMVNFSNREGAIWVSPGDALWNYTNFITWSMDGITLVRDSSRLFQPADDNCSIVEVEIPGFASDFVRSFFSTTYDLQKPICSDLTLGLYYNVTVTYIPLNGELKRFKLTYYVKPGSAVGSEFLPVCSTKYASCNVSNGSVVTNNMFISVTLGNVTALEYTLVHHVNITKDEVDEEIDAAISDTPGVIAVDVTSNSDDMNSYTIVVFVNNENADNVNQIMTSCMDYSDSDYPSSHSV